MNIKFLLKFSLILCLITGSVLGDDLDLKLQAISSKLLGVPLAKKDSRYRLYKKWISKGEELKVAEALSEYSSFYRVTLRNFTAPLTNKNFSPQVVFNDMEALMIGTIRDERDFREILYADTNYQAPSRIQSVQVSRKNNIHYRSFESGELDILNDLVRSPTQWKDSKIGSGVFTTRTWGEAHYKAGTNRRSVQYAFEAFLCRPIDSWKTPALPDIYVRRDVTRTPSDNPAIFQGLCKNCHSPMDAMGGAFARYDFENGEIKFSSEFQVMKKMNQNGDVYAEGYVTMNSEWRNLLADLPGSGFGFKGKTNGEDLKSFGKMLADSEAFSQCMVQKIFETLCGEGTSPLVQKMTKEFKMNGYNLKKIFQQMAVNDECMDQQLLNRVPPITWEHPSF